MKVAITGATGFLGHYIVERMHTEGNKCRCWYRSQDNCYQPDQDADVEWVAGALGDSLAVDELLDGCDAVVNIQDDLFIAHALFPLYWVGCSGRQAIEYGRYLDRWKPP